MPVPQGVTRPCGTSLLLRGVLLALPERRVKRDRRGKSANSHGSGTSELLEFSTGRIVRVICFKRAMFSVMEPAINRSIWVSCSRLFSVRSPSTSASKGCRIVGTRVTPPRRMFKKTGFSRASRKILKPTANEPPIYPSRRNGLNFKRHRGRLIARGYERNRLVSAALQRFQLPPVAEYIPVRAERKIVNHLANLHL